MQKFRKELKGFIVGSITTAILMTGIVGFAEGAWKTIDVAMNSVKINVNGKEVKGNNFIYDETTYVPLRSISDGFNKEITWDNDTRTVNINDKVSGEKPLPVPTKDITKVDNKIEVKNNDIQTIKYNGNDYIGEVTNGKPNGFGKMIYKDKVYIGEFKDGIREGYGYSLVTTGENKGNKFIGGFKKDVVEELGLLLSLDGMKTLGEFKNGNPNGIIYVNNNKGSKSVSEIAEGNLNGMCYVINGEDKTKYIGDIKDNFQEGNGYSVLNNGDKYIGSFKNNSYNGYGIYLYSNGKKDNGMYKDGKLQQTSNVQVENNNIETNSQIKAIIDNTTISNKDDLKRYLENKFSTLDTCIGKTNFTFDVSENTSQLGDYDYWIQMEYDYNFFEGAMGNVKYTKEQKEQLKNELKNFQELLGRTITSKVSNKKIKGGYYHFWYTYPVSKVGFNANNYYTWCNYETKGIPTYDNSKISSFNWTSKFDTQFEDDALNELNSLIQ